MLRVIWHKHSFVSSQNYVAPLKEFNALKVIYGLDFIMPLNTSDLCVPGVGIIAMQLKYCFICF